MAYAKQTKKHYLGGKKGVFQLALQKRGALGPPQEQRGSRKLTSSTVHLDTCLAVRPETSGKSLQCCSQQRWRRWLGLESRAGMKMDWWRACWRLKSRSVKKTRQVRASFQEGAITEKKERSEFGGKSKAGHTDSQALLLQGTVCSQGMLPHPPEKEKQTNNKKKIRLPGWI